jgi:hypothetical protein
VSSALVGTGVLAGLLLFALLTIRPAGSGAPTDVANDAEYVGAAFLGLFAAIAVSLAARWGYRIAQRRAAPSRMAPIAAAAHAFSHGDLDGAARILTPCRDSPFDLVAGQAHLYTALIAERRGDFAASLRACELGLGRLGDLKTRLASGLLHPDLIAQRAFALAVHDRVDEAEAELAWLAGSSYPHHGRAAFRVRLVELVRAGRVQEAAAWVDSFGGELPLSLQEELLADLARAVGAPEETGAGEEERLRDELRRVENRTWIAAVAPKLLETFESPPPASERGPARVRVATAEDGAFQDAQAEVEALAAEADAAVARRQ